MRLFKFTSMSLLTLSLISTPSFANLLTNGGFENPDITSRWTYGPDPTKSWQGDNIEVWSSGFGRVQSAEGTQHAELNAHPRDGTQWSIYQDFETVANIPYIARFAYRARVNDKERFNFQITDSDTSFFDLDFSDHTITAWNYFTGTFLGSGKTNTIRFTSLRPRAGTYGNFIDDVSITAMPAFSLRAIIPIPEPPVVIIFMLGLLGVLLGFRRKLNQATK